MSECKKCHGMGSVPAELDDEQQRYFAEQGRLVPLVPCPVCNGAGTSQQATFAPGTHPVEVLWRKLGLPEYFLGNGGTNAKLYALYDAIKSEASAVPPAK